MPDDAGAHPAPALQDNPSQFTVSVKQYMRPLGRAVPQSTRIPIQFKPAYERMRARGWNLAAEVLTTGEISITVEDPHEETDRAIRIVHNLPNEPQRAIGEVLEEACPISQ